MSIDRTKLRCWYCGTIYDNYYFDIDHKTPLSRGGADDVDNKVLACVSCNRVKSDRTVSEFRLMLAFRNNISEDEILFYGEGGSPFICVSKSNRDLNSLENRKLAKKKFEDNTRNIRAMVTDLVASSNVTTVAQSLNVSVGSVIRLISGHKILKGTIANFQVGLIELGKLSK
jgi:CRISPR/Cas system Type II protein with McrA/HNH and RuvC-like nuclease domain